MPLFKWTQSLIMGKPFKVELEKLAGTIKWAEQQDVTALRSFFSLNAGTPLICIGSGGSYSAASYAAMLYKQMCGLAVPMTPLAFDTYSDTVFRESTDSDSTLSGIISVIETAICSLSSQKYLLDSFMRIRLRGVKRLLFSPQYIEQQISIFNVINYQMKERKSIIYSLIKVAHSFKNSLNTVFLPIIGLLGACFTLINVNCVKNAIFENYFEQFSHFSTV